MINWKVRLKNKNFWISFIPTVILLIQAVAAVFGIEIDLGAIGDKLITVVSIAFVVLAMLGVVNDPTTEGISDSQNALTYEEPKKKD